MKKSKTILANQKRIYLDYAATTPLRGKAKRAMDRYWDIDFGNAGAIHQEGVVAKKAIEKARQQIAKSIHAHADEIIFNSGGTEGNSSALLGVVNHLRDAGKAYAEMHLITTAFEHPSVLQGFKYLEKKGAMVDYLKIKADGIIDLDHFKEILNPQTVFISVMLANNEIGTIQPVEQVAKMVRNFRKRITHADIFPIMHSDAAQALLFLPINVQKLGVDLISLDAQKIYGPKGVGVLFRRRGVEINSLIIGGSQERGLRPGTENTPLIVGFAKALELAKQEQDQESERLQKLRDYFIQEVLNKIPRTALNGSPKQRLPNNINITFADKNNEFLVLQLDARGIACSTKSACIKEGDSYVIASLGENNKKTSNNSVRFTLGRYTTKKDLDYVVKALQDIYIK